MRSRCTKYVFVCMRSALGKVGRLCVLTCFTHLGIVTHTHLSKAVTVRIEWDVGKRYRVGKSRSFFFQRDRSGTASRKWDSRRPTNRYATFLICATEQSSLSFFFPAPYYYFASPWDRLAHTPIWNAILYPRFTVDVTDDCAKYSTILPN